MKYIFSKGLYREGLKRTRALTIALLVIAVAWTAISFFNNVAIYNCNISTQSTSSMYTTISNITGILPVLAFVMSIGLGFCAFSFLNRRNASDFYHAIPYSRSTLFFSNVLACMTQMLIIIVVTLAIPAIGCLFVNLGFYYVLLPQAFLCCFVSSMLMFAITALAMSITGTRFTNIVLLGLIMFLPRMITTLAASMITSLVPIVPVFDLGIFFNSAYNIPVALFLATFDIWGSSSFEGIFTNQGAVIYTAVLAAVYIVLGALFFIKRKSETAENSAPGRILQCAYRCAVGSVFAIVFAAALIEYADTVLLVILALASIISYMLFELITTKSLMKMLKSLATYGIVIAIAVAFYFSVNVSASIASTKKPKSDEINSIQVLSRSVMSSNYDSFSSIAYSEYVSSNTRITSKEAIATAADMLESTINHMNDDRTQPNSYYGTDGPQSTIYIKYNTKSGSMTRNVYMTMEESEYFTSLLDADAKYSAAASVFPDDSDIQRIGTPILTEKEAKAVWKSLRSECKDSSSLLFHEDRPYYDDTNIALTVMGTYSLKPFSDTYMIDTKTVPETAKLYLQYYNRHMKEERALEKLYEGFDKIEAGDKSSGVELQYSFIDKENAQALCSEYTQSEDIASEVIMQNYCAWSLGDGITVDGFATPADYEYAVKVRELLPEIIKRAALADEIGKNTIKLTANIWKESVDKGYPTYTSSSYSLILNVSDEDYKCLVEIMSNYITGSSNDILYGVKQ